MFSDSILLVLLVPFVKEVLHGEALDYGWMQTAIGAGSLAGGFAIGYLHRVVTPARLLPLSIGAVGVITLVIANSRSLHFLLAGATLLGMAVPGWLVSQQTLLQNMVADRYRGRVFGAHGTTTTLLMLGGMGCSGVLSSSLGVARAVEVAGGCYILAAAMALVMLRSTILRPAIAIDSG